jgi:putative membrane protein insertion efficiency factor
MCLRVSVGKTPARLLIYVIRIYQRVVSPISPPSCRFYPSCSEYSIAALSRYGLFIGIFKTVIRLSKCHPFHQGGYDPLI